MAITPIPYPSDLPPGSQQFARGVIKAIEEIDRSRSVAASDQLATDKGLAASLQALSNQINAIPITTSQVSTASNVSNAFGSYTTRTTLSFTIPDNKSVANVFVVGNAQFLDTLTGGLAVSYMKLRINGVDSPGFSAAKDAGASVVNNVMFGSYAAKVTNSTFNVDLQTYATNPSAFPTSAANFYNLSVVVTYNA